MCRWRLLNSTWFGIVVSFSLAFLFSMVYPLEMTGAIVIIGLGLSSWLAYENGGNDVSRGVAPLVACQATSMKKGLIFGTVVTIVGSIFSLFISMKIYNLFTNGILNSEYLISPLMIFSIILGASTWVAIATKYSLPVSTTHSLVGAMVMIGCLSFGLDGVLWHNVGLLVVLPLLVSPLIGFGVTFLLALYLKRVKNIKKIEKYSIWVFCAGICFVRAVNDTPKIAGMAVLIGLSTIEHVSLAEVIPFFILITVSMAIGSYLKGSCVTETLAYKVTPMNITTSFSTAISSATLILLASKFGLPVSTTHVSTSSVIGAGFAQEERQINWNVVKDILLSWVVTLPGAGFLALMGYYIVSLLL